LTYRKAFLIYNPVAGALRKPGRKHVLQQAIETLKESGIAVEAAATTGPGVATELARNCVDRGADLILVAGGDGTINEVANGMVHSLVPLGVLPAGTANVLAMELSIGRRMEKTASALRHCVPARVAVGRITNEFQPDGRHFLLMAGIGLDAHIVYQMPSARKAALGKAAYWVGGFSQLGRRFPEFAVEADGKEYRTSFALVSRVRNYGGDLEIAPTISLLEDNFEIVLFSGENSFRYLKYMLGVVTRRLQNMQGVTILRARKISCRAPEDQSVYVQVDGEYAGRLPSTLEIIPNALTLLIPSDFHQRRPAGAHSDAWTTSPTR
jgi:YegS/Rv2252/BmrU family lipid kinase